MAEIPHAHEFTRAFVAIRVTQKLHLTDTLDMMTGLFLPRGITGHILHHNGPERVAKAVRNWIDAVGAETSYIEPRAPGEIGYCETFNTKYRDELVDSESDHSMGLARATS